MSYEPISVRVPQPEGGLGVAPGRKQLTAGQAVDLKGQCEPQGRVKAPVYFVCGCVFACMCVILASQGIIVSSSTGVLKQDSDPKHTAQSTHECQRTKNWIVQKLPSMSSDLNPIQHLWKELELSVWRRHP